MVRVIEGRSSWRSRALSALLRLTSREPLLQDTDISALRRRYEDFEARHFPAEKWVAREWTNCNGVIAEWISVPESRPGRVVLYLHGGSFAFRFPNTYAMFAARLCRRFAARALIPDYRLAPEHPFPAAPDDCHAVYRWLLATGHDSRDLILVGDSAGGNLALVTLGRARQAGEPLPACAVLLSPAVDCTLTSPSMVDNEERDPVLHLRSLLVLRHHYVPSPHLHMHPEVSPIFADFTGYPPLFLQAGSSEMMRDEAIRTAQRANAAGVHVELELWPETPHVFQVASFLPESVQALDHIERFVLAHTGWKTTSSAQ
ncbi:MAG: alpha/beta hydrolase [Gemmatimonas sp.]|nr:alpha/beta hydrolase [Gemmatimonas sp.]